MATFSSLLDNENLRLIIFGGKGGSGKTTSCAATAVHFSQGYDNKRILIVSTDPAHSLGDSFDCSIGNKIIPVPSVKNIWAIEIDAAKMLEEFNAKHGTIIKKLADRGTYFDTKDINDIFSLSLPGLDEIMAIIRIADILKSGDYDLIVLDTAPTGHTINLLALPEQLVRWIQVMDLMQEKHRYLSKQFAGRYVKDDADEFLETMSKDVERVKSLLKNSQTTEFIPVTIPEPMSISETERLLKALRRFRIPVRSIIINRLMGEGECVFCSSKRREQQGFLAEMDGKFAGYNLVKMPLFPHEIRGVGSLREFAGILFGKSYHYQPARRVEPVRYSECRNSGVLQAFISRVEPSPEIPPTSSAKMSDLLEKDLQFILFGGKGGVGKTSMAAATALKMAEQHPDKKILTFSTDPAHALSDSFGCPIGNKVTLIEGSDNLYALEIDAARLLEDFKQEYRADIEEVFDKFLGGKMDIKFDREVMTELIELSPPGLDEIMALKQIMDFVDDGQFDQYILDSAATGHLLRFLELPNLVKDWLKTLFKLLLKYKGVVKLTHTAETMLELAKSVRRIQETLMDPIRTEFVMVAIPEAMGILEMERLLSALKKLKIPCQHIVINMVIPPTECSFCASKREEQQGHIQKAKVQFSDYLFTEIPLLPYEIKGIDRLNNFSKIIYKERKNS